MESFSYGVEDSICVLYWWWQERGETRPGRLKRSQGHANKHTLTFRLYLGWLEWDSMQRQQYKEAGSLENNVGLSSDFFFSLSFCHSWEVCGVFPGGCALTIWRATHIHVAPSGRQLSCFSMIHRRDEYLQVDRKWQKKKYRLMWGKMHFVPFYLHRIRHPGRCRSGVEIRKFDNFQEMFVVPSHEFQHFSVLLLLQFGNETLQHGHFKLNVLRHLVERRKNVKPRNWGSAKFSTEVCFFGDESITIKLLILFISDV